MHRWTGSHTRDNNDDDHYDCCAYNNDYSANDHHFSSYDDTTNNYSANDDISNHDAPNICPWVTSICSCRGCIFLELGSRHEPFGISRELHPHAVAPA